MSRCRCADDSDLCTYCRSRQEAAEYGSRDDAMADRYADKEAGW